MFILYFRLAAQIKLPVLNYRIINLIQHHENISINNINVFDRKTTSTKI